MCGFYFKDSKEDSMQSIPVYTFIVPIIVFEYFTCICNPTLSFSYNEIPFGLCYKRFCCVYYIVIVEGLSDSNEPYT